MAGNRTPGSPLQTRDITLDILRSMYLTFLDEINAKTNAIIDAQFTSDLLVHNISYDSRKKRFIARPEGATDEVDELQILELTELAERYDTPIEVEGILVGSYIPATFIIKPCGKLRIILDFSHDSDATWNIIAADYALITMIEVSIAGDLGGNYG